MSPRRNKSPEYPAARDATLKRDGMRCQFCGRREHLQVHHIEFRSQGGADDPDNLITLCSDCHHDLHAGGGW
jgi:5-methylcytosine-specific restriction endonuclease McrA